MDDLPVVVLSEILNFLSIRERLKLKTICKKWKFVVETFCSQQNVCIYSHAYPFNRCWCWSDQRVVEEDLLYLKFNFQNSPKLNLKMPFFRNLQKVYLYHIDEKVDLFLEEVNLLTNLKVLMVEESIIKTRKLSSSSLEKFSMKYSNSDYIELDTPNLCSLTWWNYELQRIQPIGDFKFPLKIQHLECVAFNLNLSRLRNLESLICQRIDFDFKLEDFKHLTRLELFPVNEEELRVARNIRNEKSRMERNSLKMTVSGFKGESFICKRNSHLPYYFQLHPEYLEQVVQNSSNLVGSLPWDFLIEIPTLLQFSNSFLPDFFDKFRNIKIIKFRIGQNDRNITESDQHNLMEFIRQSQTKELYIHGLDLSLEKEFYEQLSSVQSLTHLRIGPHLENVEFDYFLKLKNLQKFIVTSSKISANFVSKLFEGLKLLEDFQFVSRLGEFGIQIYLNTSPDPEEEMQKLHRPFNFKYSYWPRGGANEKFFLVNRYTVDVNELVQEIALMRQDERTQCFVE